MGSYGGLGPTVNAVLWVETVLGIFFTVLRVYTRKRILRSFGWDDGMLVATCILFVAYVSCVSVATGYGLGRLRAEIPPEDYIQAMKFEIIGQGICIFNLVTAKAAVAFFLLRVVFKIWHKVLIWLCIISNAALATWGSIAVFIQCTPVEKVWDFSVPGECWLDFASIGLVVSAYAVAMDFILALAPCFVIWELNMKRKEKILIMSGLSLGVFAGLCGILRTVALKSLRSFDEYIYDTVDMLIYSGTENFVTIMCASIPVLRPLYMKLRDRSQNESTDESAGRGGYKMRRFGSKDPEAVISVPSRGVLETKIYSSSKRQDAANDNASEETILRDSKAQDVQSNEVYYHTEITRNYSDAKVAQRRNGS